MICFTLLAVAFLTYFLLQKRPVYMVDFSVYKPPDRCAAQSAHDHCRVLTCIATIPITASSVSDH